MSTSININLMASEAAGNLTSHYGRLNTSVQRLSSGLRVNSAADDAAGLAIRELMRSDVAALNQGVRNANDAISMLQVADGALAIIDEKLIRMKELAEQAATGTYDSTQRLMIDSEYKAMAREIDRIANATDFNGIKLLDGSLSGAHNGAGLNSTGALKIHFGSANDSAEDYYYVSIGDCTTAGLGLGAVMPTIHTTIKKVETVTQTQMTFTPQDSWVVYRDPVTRRPYYTDGDYFFSSSSYPAGSRLDWETDREIIERLETEIEQASSYAAYDIWVDKTTGREYYTTDKGATFSSNSSNPAATKLDEKKDAAIIARLEDTGKKHNIWISWDKYQNANGDILYTCDGALTFVPNKERPIENVLDTANPAHKEILKDYDPVLVARKNDGFTQRIDYLDYYDTRNNTNYYSSDGGKTFVSSTSNPLTTALDPTNPRDKEIIDHLAPRYYLANYQYTYERYVHLDTGTEYYTRDGGKTFVDDTSTPADIVLNSANSAHAADIARLEKQYAATTGRYIYDVYEDRSDPDNIKLWYTGDGGNSFFSDTRDPKGTVLTSADPSFAFIAQFVKANRVETVTVPAVDIYNDPNSSNVYYTADGGQTFSTNYMNLQDVALDSSNSADLAKIQSLQRRPARDFYNVYFNWYTDPDTGIDYYTTLNGSGAIYTRDMEHPENAALDSSNSADKVIIDRLVQHQVESWGTVRFDQAPKYEVWESTAVRYEVYSWEGEDGVTRYGYSTETVGFRADSPEGQALAATLSPYIVTKVETTYVNETEIIPGGIGGPTISTQQLAQNALVAVNRAIVSKDKIRAHLGALQNRLENTVANLSIQSENLKAAESRISDADVAQEMMAFVRNQILTQSSVAMLGQANSYPHMLLELLNR